MRRTGWHTAWLLLGLAWLFPAQAADVDPMSETDHGVVLEKHRGGRFKETWVDMSVDFSAYDSLYLANAVFDYREVKNSRFTAGIYSSNNSLREYEISEESRKTFEKVVKEAFYKEIVTGKQFTVVEADQAGARTLILRGAVVDVISRVPPTDAMQRDLYMANVGAATLGLELLDGSTGEIVARVAERGLIGDARGSMSSRPVNRASVLGAVTRWANSAARRLRLELDEALVTD